jgi:hypothetical protein
VYNRQEYGVIHEIIATQDATLSTRGELETANCDSVEGGA